MTRFRELLWCVKRLGIRLGWGYWRVQAHCRKHPEDLPELARQCRIAGISNPSWLVWAEEIEKHVH